MKQNLQDKLEIRLRAYSINEVAELYQFSLKSMKTWLSHYAKEIGPRMGHYYTPKQMKIIFDCIGKPEIVPLK